MRGAGAVLEQMEAAHVGQVRVFDAEVWTGWVSQGWVARHLGCLPRDASQGCVPGGEASRCGGECVGMGWVWGGARRGSGGRLFIGNQGGPPRAHVRAGTCWVRKLTCGRLLRWLPWARKVVAASLIRLASPRAARQA